MILKDSYMFEEIEQAPDHIFVLKQDLKDQVPQHKHSKAHFLVVLDGVASLDVENSQYVIPYGYFVWIPAEVKHRVSFSGKMVSLLNVYVPNDIERAAMFDEVGVYPIPSILPRSRIFSCSINISRS